jgi:hypothetical protein
MRAGTNIPDADALIARHDVGCPSCGHSLRGITVDLCPECGRPFDRQTLAFVSSDLGLSILFQTPVAMLVLLAANLALGIELLWAVRAAAAVAATDIMAFVLIIARSALLLAFLAPAAVCVYHLLGEPTLNPRATAASMSVSAMGNRTGREQVAWAAAWLVTLLGVLLWAVGLLL